MFMTPNHVNNALIPISLNSWLNIQWLIFWQDVQRLENPLRKHWMNKVSHFQCLDWTLSIWSWHWWNYLNCSTTHSELFIYPQWSNQKLEWYFVFIPLQTMNHRQKQIQPMYCCCKVNPNHCVNVIHHSTHGYSHVIEHTQFFRSILFYWCRLKLDLLLVVNIAGIHPLIIHACLVHVCIYRPTSVFYTIYFCVSR